MLNKIKTYGLIAWTVVTAVLAALFFYEKNKADIGKALFEQDKVNKDVEKLEAKVDVNDQTLKDEASKREALKKEDNNVSKDPLNDLNDRLNKH